MYQPIILSDEEDQNEISTPFPVLQSKKRRTESDLNPTVVVLDDDPTPQKLRYSSTPSFVAETPMSVVVNSDVTIVKCTIGSSDHQTRVSTSMRELSGIDGLICLESDNESENISGREKWKENVTRESSVNISSDSEWIPKFTESMSSTVADQFISSGSATLTYISDKSLLHSTSSLDVIHQVHDYLGTENASMEQEDNIVKKKRSKVNAETKNNTSESMRKKNTIREERARLMEEKKLKKEQEKLRKEVLKAETEELKKIKKEMQKWENSKFAVKSIVAEIDAKVVESGSIGGHLLTRLAEKGLTYRIASNPIERSIVWSMNVPENISQLSPRGMQISYILLVYEADEFCNLVNNGSLLDHVSSMRSCYPSYTVCYLTNRLMSYINKREQETYKNPANNGCWRRPPVDEVLAKLTTHFANVHSRQCVDEAEVAEHVAGLTCSLASCQFRQKLTRLSVNANGSLIPKDATDRNLIKKSLWLKALIAIPKVQPRFAIAISKKYPTMRSLLSVYMDPSKPVCITI